MAPEDNFSSQPVTAAPEAAPQNFFSRLIGVWFSPGETFQEIGRAPRPLIPIIASIVLGLVIGFVLTQRLDVSTMMSKMFEKAVADGQMTQEQADQRVKVAASFGKAQFLLFGALGNLLIALIIAGIFKLVSMLMGTENQYPSLFVVTLYSFLAVGIISSILFIVTLYLKDPTEITFDNLGSLVSSNLGALLSLALGEKALPKFVMALAQRIDVFSIWIITLLSIGYAAVSRRMKVGTAALWLTSLYVVYALIVATFAAIRG
jgi:Yip1 domain